ncbi:MAG: hypothetical protein ACPHF4_11295, partial [Rubripirellula sp.]
AEAKVELENLVPSSLWLCCERILFQRNATHGDARMRKKTGTGVSSAEQPECHGGKASLVAGA